MKKIKLLNSGLRRLLLGLLLLFSSQGWGQILSFEFSALAGSEITATSTFNDTNLFSSTISRGAGLTASANGGRFNATNWALTSIDSALTGDDYMSFTVTPISGYMVTIDSLFLQMQRSSTGPREIALRSSLDNYTGNLDKIYSITDTTTTQNFTFSFTPVDISEPVTFRIYMYAESKAGSGGIGDGSGNDLIVYGSVSATPLKTLTIIGPNGGESWQSGTSQDIIWTSTDYSSTIDIEYYDGSSYVLIADDETNDGTFNWSVPVDLAGNNYRIRISDDYSNITTSDESDADFTISAIANDETNITAFSFAEQTAAALIDDAAHKVVVEVAYGTSLTDLIATFELSAGATAEVGVIAQESGTTANDFSSDVTYTITAQDGLTTQDWTVRVTLEVPSSVATLDDLQVDGTTVTGFNAGTVVYNVELPFGTTTVPTVTYTLSDATATAIRTDAESLPGTTSIELTAQDSTTKNDYRINFTVAAPSTDATVSSTSYTVDNGLETLTDIPFGTSLAAFKAELSSATGASFEVYLTDAITVATDLQSGYTVVVTAQDGTTQKTYTLTIDEPIVDLFFSEYIEGSGSNKALEIYNPTGIDVDLSAYSVKLATNGATWGTTLVLSGTLTAGDVYVIYNSSAVQAIKDVGDITSGVANFNGDDAVGLFKNDMLIDVIGQVGEDPGTSWAVADDASGTANQTLVRKAEITFGSINWEQAAGTNADDSQWLVYSLDELSYLGSHFQFTDNTAPVVSFSPLNGSSQVTETTNITLSFDEEIFNADGSVLGNDNLAAKLSFFKTNTPANTQPFVASLVDQQILVNPTGDLKLGMQYTLSLLANTLEDAAGNENTESSTTFTVREARTIAEVASAVYTVDNDNSTISGVPFSEDLATFKTNVLALSGASYDVYQSDGISIASDLQDGYQLICVAEDGLTQKTYTINKIAFVNNETGILSFAVPEQTGAALIDADAHTISIQVPYGSSRSAMVAAFTLSAGATAIVGTTPQVSGETANNFESTLTYSILAEDEITSQDWQVSITPEAPNTDAGLSALFIDELAVDGFSAEVYNYTKEYPYGTASVPVVTFTLNDASASAEMTEAESMPGTTSVKVTAQDGVSTQTYNVEFTWEAASTEAFVTSEQYLVNNTENTISGIPYGTSLAAFKANLTPAAFASFEVYQSNGTKVAEDLLSGYLVIVTAQDGITQKTYVLTLDEAPTADLFFSEYLEGSSSNKALEIYNPTGSDVDLSAYSVKLATNGATWGTTLTLSGTLTAGDVYVIYNSSAAQAIIDVGDITSGVANFNGDDAVGLFKNNVLIDVIGNVGEDPGSAWAVAGEASGTADKTLVRKAFIEIGTTDWALCAGTNTDDSQWLVYSQDEFSYLGSHVQAPDTEGPVATFEPHNNASEVFVAVHPTLTFNENVFDANGLAFADGADVSTLLECYETATSVNTVAFTASITGRVITVIPDATLANSTQYTLVLKADAVEDKAGNQNLTTQASFTTIDASVQSLSLTYPTGGEVFYAGDQATLTWNAANIANIKVEVYVPRFDAWTELLASTDATAGSVALTVGADSYYGNTYKIRISDVSNPSMNAVSGDFEIIAVPQTLAALRSQGAGAKVKFAGNATVTMVQSYRNQKFIQDATAAILIDDATAKITSAYVIDDNISGIEGSLSEYGGMLQLLPSADPGASSGTGAVIVPEELTLEAFAADFEAYEGELIVFSNVKFSEANGSLAFTTGASYMLSDLTNTVNFYTNFYDADYIGTVLPETTGNLRGIVHSRTTGNYITARFATDMSFPSNDASLSAITLDGTPLDGFAPSVYSYSVSLTAGTTEVPVLAATANEANASIGIISATALPGTTSVMVTAQDGVTQQTYTVQFSVTPYNTDATLSSLSYNGTAVDGFTASQFEYSVVLPYGTTTVPVVAAVSTDSKAEIVLTQAIQLPGDAFVKVTAEDTETILSYTIHFSLAPNNDATLSDILVGGLSLATFVPGTLEYILSVSNEIVPVVSAVANDANASVNIVQATSVPGFASIQVTAEDNTTVLTYKVTFVDESLSHDASLSSLSIDEVHLATFVPNVFVYEVELPYGTTTIPAVNARLTDEKASLIITQAAQLPGEATVVVTAEDGETIQTYTVKFSLAPNNDATLHGITVNNEAINEFNASTFAYQVILPYGTTNLPLVAASSNDLNASLVITQAEGIPGTATILVTAEDGQTQLTYTVSFTLALNNDATLSDILVDGLSLATFVPGTLEYILSVSNEIVPVVSAVANDAKASVNIVQATAVPGFASIQVTAEDNTTVLTYKVTFVDESLSHDASLSSLSTDEVHLATFVPNVFVYEVELPYGTTTIPVVNATTTDANASLQITQATQLPGDATVLVTAEDGGTQQTYTLKFSLALNSDATLHGITVNGEAISSFDANTFDYQVLLPYGTTDLPLVAASSNDLNATLDITQAEAIPGTATILVTAEDGQTQLTYTVSFTLARNNDASLSTITVDDHPLANFDATMLSYKVELPNGTTTVPVVAATASDANALVDIVQATELPGTATITVTAEDGETKTVYSIDFTLAVEEVYTVTFNVVDEDGNPVEGATVLFNTETQLTDNTGEAIFIDIIPVSEAPFTISKAEVFVDYQGTLSVVDADISVDVVLLFVGINNESALESSIHPNPGQGEFTIVLHQVSPGTFMTINDLSGMIIMHSKINKLETRIDLSQAKAGVYILRIQSSEKIFKGRIILTK